MNSVAIGTSGLIRNQGGSWLRSEVTAHSLSCRSFLFLLFHSKTLILLSKFFTAESSHVLHGFLFRLCWTTRLPVSDLHQRSHWSKSRLLYIKHVEPPWNELSIILFAAWRTAGRLRPSISTPSLWGTSWRWHDCKVTSNFTTRGAITHLAAEQGRKKVRLASYQQEVKVFRCFGSSKTSHSREVLF